MKRCWTPERSVLRNPPPTLTSGRTRSSPVAQQSMTLEPTSSIRPCTVEVGLILGDAAQRAVLNELGEGHEVGIPAAI
jgi:hypothetical protein